MNRLAISLLLVAVLSFANAQTTFFGSGTTSFTGDVTTTYPTLKLGANTSAGAATFSVDRLPTNMAAARGLLVIDPYTTEAELRLVTSVSGAVVTPNAVLTYAHSSGDTVLFIPFGLVPWTLWGAKNTGLTADATTNTTGFNRLSAQIYAVGVAKGPSGIFVPAGTYYIDGELIIERDQTLAGASPNATLIKAHTTFPFTDTGEVAMIHPRRDGLPVLYATPGPSGRWFMRDFMLSGSDIANSNGIISSPQQPDHWENIRIDDCAGLYGMCIVDCQQHIMYNMEFIGCNVGLRYRSAEFVWVWGLNIEQSLTSDFIAETQGGGGNCSHNHFFGVHLESLLDVGEKHFDITSGDGWIFENVWMSNQNVASTLFYFNIPEGAISDYPLYELRNIRANGNFAAFKMVDDVPRGLSLDPLTENRLIPLLISGTGVSWALRLRADGKLESLYERWGTGSPEGVVAAPVGAIYHRTNGGTGTSNYFKETGAATSSGWVAK